MSSTGRPIGSESGSEVAGAEEGREGVAADGRGVSLWGDEMIWN